MTNEQASKTTEPRDAQLDPLLNEALGVDSVEIPAGLADRIVAQTVDELTDGKQAAVAGRIGFMRAGLAAAAVIAVAAALSLWFGGEGGTTTGGGSDTSIAAIEADLEELTSYGLDTEMQLLVAQVELLEADALAASDADSDPLEELTLDDVSLF